jgi:methionyl aminopeptidase
LKAGDILSIDCGAEFNGWNGDSAFSIVVPGEADAELVASRQQLSDVTEASLWVGIAALAKAEHLNEVGTAIEAYIYEQAEQQASEDHREAFAARFRARTRQDLPR